MGGGPGAGCTQGAALDHRDTATVVGAPVLYGPPIAKSRLVKTATLLLRRTAAETDTEPQSVLICWESSPRLASIVPSSRPFGLQRRLWRPQKGRHSFRPSALQQL